MCKDWGGRLGRVLMVRRHGRSDTYGRGGAKLSVAASSPLMDIREGEEEEEEEQPCRRKGAEEALP